jgi:hypothetical protein
MGRYLDIIEAESTNRQGDKSDISDESHLEPVPKHEGACNFATKAPRCGFQGSATTPPPGGAAAVSTPQGPIPWHDATPDERAEIKAALFEGLPVQIYSKVLGEVVWWVKDEAVARWLKGGEFVRGDTRPTEVKPSMSGRNCSL